MRVSVMGTLYPAVGAHREDETQKSGQFLGTDALKGHKKDLNDVLNWDSGQVRALTAGLWPGPVISSGQLEFHPQICLE